MDLNGMRLARAAWALCLMVAGLSMPPVAWAEPPAQDRLGLRVVDQRGRVLVLSQAPRRIISLLPSLTETLCALDACDRLVGVDRASNHPASVKALPQVGGLEDANLEWILSLKPDWVLAAESTRGLDRMTQLGVPVTAFEPRSQAQAEATFLTLAAVLSVPDAKDRWARLMQPMHLAAQRVPRTMLGHRTYIEVATGPYAAGAASFMGELIAGLGLVNVVPSNLGPFPKLNPEFVVRADPQIILTTSSTLAAMRRRPGWSSIDAVKAGRVCELRGADADVFSRPGPRLPLAATAIAACLARWA